LFDTFLDMHRPIVVVLLASAVLLPALIATEARDGEPLARRQQAMKDMAAAAKTVAGMFGGTLAYDRATFRQAADVFVSHSGSRLVALFDGNIPASSSAEDEKIARERQAFDEVALRLGHIAAAFEEKADEAGATITPGMRMGSGMSMGGGSLLGAKPPASETDLETIPAEHLFHMMLETCTDCHAKFRRRR
jgi:cytochrome c556